jgi:hypothetical protein
MDIFLIPRHVQVDVRISLDPALLSLLREVFGDGDTGARIAAATVRLDTAARGLAAVVSANPDPDITD